MASPAPPSYVSQQAWRKQMAFLPEALRWKEGDASVLPTEAVFAWRGHDVHLDRYDVAGAKALLILLHGVGTNGRQMSLLVGATLATKHRIACVAVDLPGYGVTRVKRSATVTYDDWVRLVSDLVDAEAAKDAGRPILLYGLSAGGMLAYHAAAVNGKVRGVVGMTFLDQRSQTVRDATAHDLFMSRVGVPLGGLVAGTPLGKMKLPMRLTSKMWALVNSKAAAKVFLADKTSAGNWVSTRFLSDYMSYTPAVEPEEFATCPILLTQPAEDQWTPLRLSELFLSRVKKVAVTTKMLQKAGHYPLEQPGIDQLHAAIVEFVDTIVAGGGGGGSK